MPRFSRVQIICCLITSCLTLVYAYDCKAQFTDNFNDGNFTANPTWTGTDLKFTVQNGVLKLKAPAVSETAYLSAPSQAINNASWEFLVTITGSTSSANYADVYLVVDEPALTGPVNGYFVRIGNTADEVSLYQQTGTAKTKIIDGADGRVNQTLANIKVKVTRDADGAWQLFTDATASGYVPEGGVTNNDSFSSAYFGVVCVYSATRSNDFAFDDFVVSGEPYVDPSQPADYKDVIITEIFPDPSPVIGLPEAEFIEIFNRSNKIINLAGWKFTDGSSTATLSGMLNPGEYRIISSTSTASEFSTFGVVTGVANFPTLNNNGDNLELRRKDDLLIDRVSYSDSWYGDEDKRQGGYTLELIDPGNPCGEGRNWIASEATKGGTPGAENSVLESKPDLTGPTLVSVIPVSETVLIIRFDEKLLADVPALTGFQLTPSIGLSSLTFTDSRLTTLQLTLTESLRPRTLYSVSVHDIFDCNGNEIQTEFSTASFALPEPAEEKDLIVNEILFNPRPTGVDFAEVYNNSDKYISLKNWSISNYVDGTVLNAKIISSEDFLIAPRTYLVFAEDKDLLKGEYVRAAEENIFVVDELPSFNDDEGTVALLDADGHVIDFFSYSDNYHTVFLNNDEGVSLERISAEAITNDRANWRSASSASGFATPGYVNSNARGELLADRVNVDPEIFEPVNGQPAFTQIHYNFNAGGYVANVKILDGQGRQVKQLASNALLGTTGFFRWDGDCEDGSKARTGYYTVWIEVFDAKGSVESFRKRVIVGSSF